MSGLLSDPGRLLAAWEQGASAPPAARGAAVVAATGLVSDESSVLDLPLAVCAALAVHAYVDSFGREVACAATCPGCAELFELVLDLRTLPAVPAVPVVPEMAPAGVTTVAVAGVAVTVRALSTRDLIDAATAEDPRALLLNRCLVAVDGGAGAAEAVETAGAVETAVEEAAERLAGAAGIVVRALCPGCGTEVRAGLDPGLLLWEQVTTAAERLLVEVAELAAAYGWTESEVLRLSPVRRAAYRELASQ
jgi:hypothetical protein